MKHKHTTTVSHFQLNDPVLTAVISSFTLLCIAVIEWHGVSFCAPKPVTHSRCGRAALRAARCIISRRRRVQRLHCRSVDTSHLQQSATRCGRRPRRASRRPGGSRFELARQQTDVTEGLTTIVSRLFVAEQESPRTMPLPVALGRARQSGGLTVTHPRSVLDVVVAVAGSVPPKTGIDCHCPVRRERAQHPLCTLSTATTPGPPHASPRRAASLIHNNPFYCAL